jgi:hypothetical protein
MSRYTPDFLAAVRHRYEDTDQPMRLIAAEFEIGMTTLQTLVHKQGWSKRSHRARDLRPASRLIDDVIALADLPAPQGAAAEYSPFKLTGDRAANPEFSPPPCGEGLGVGVSVEEQYRFTTSTPLPNPPPQGGREQAEIATRADSIPAEIASRTSASDAGLAGVEAFLLNRLAAEQAAHARRGGATQESAEGERSARTISILIRALHSLRELRGENSHPETPHDDDDDMPADIDEFRNKLARRIEAFMESRADDDDAAQAHAARADEA